jgi:hypothetical protein
MPTDKIKQPSAKRWLQFGANFPPNCSRLSSRRQYDLPERGFVRRWQSTCMAGIPGHRLATSRGERCLSPIALEGSGAASSAFSPMPKRVNNDNRHYEHAH